VQVDYQLTVEDVEAAVARWQKPAPPWRLPNWVFLVGVAVFFLLIAAGQSLLRWLLLVIAVCIPLVLLLIWGILRFNRGQNQRMLRAMFAKGSHRLLLASDGFYVITPDAQTFFRWGAVRELVHTPERVFFFIGEREVQIVPRRAFASEDDFEAFVDLACRYHDGRDSPVVDARPVDPAPPDALTTKPIQDHLP
jgi:hypothetical protein